MPVKLGKAELVGSVKRWSLREAYDWRLVRAAVPVRPSIGVARPKVRVARMARMMLMSCILLVWLKESVLLMLEVVW